MKKYFSLIILFAVMLFLPQNIYSQNLLTNGSFETGNFTGWTVNSTQTTNWCTNWVVANATAGCMLTVAPQHGSFVAMNGFDGTGGVMTMYQDVAIPSGMSARITFTFRAYWSIASGASLARRFDLQVRTPGTNALLETPYTFNAPSGAPDQNSGWQTIQRSVAGYGGQTIRVYFIETIPQSFTGPAQMEIDNVIVEAFAPTAASVDIGGRVVTENGYGIGNTLVSFVDSTGTVRNARSNPFGYFNFSNVELGNTYVFQVQHKQFTFLNNPQVIQLTEARKDITFTASQGDFPIDEVQKE